MAFKYTGDAALGVGLTVETAKPLDNRTVVANLQELYSIPEKYAYQGMTVANIDNGNIYMLLDKSKINQKEGWKASYESIQIIQCTEAEYKEWKANTTNDFKPIDESKEYLHAESYYYIYEDSMEDDQFYLSAAWGKSIEEQLKEKALNTTVVALRKDLDQLTSNLNNYSTTEQIAEVYVPKSDIDLENPESFLSTTLNSYYTKLESDELFVTKESLRGEGIEGDNFVFVTKTQYDTDQQSIQEELTKTIKVNDEGVAETINTNELIIGGTQVVSQDGKLSSNGEEISLVKDVPKLVCISESEYESLPVKNKDTYYYTYNEKDLQDTGYVRSEFLYEKFYTKAEVEELIKAAVDELQRKIDAIQSGGVQIDGENEQLIF